MKSQYCGGKRSRFRHPEHRAVPADLTNSCAADLTLTGDLHTDVT